MTFADLDRVVVGTAFVALALFAAVSMTLIAMCEYRTRAAAKRTLREIRERDRGEH